ncbi:MAG: hypothetical protein M1285_03375, partial [Candidatus Thermoplasmatota archaeon]|nr:hypothetical protein [Candidatus Thermoplasmatota archaeon]
LSREFRNMCNSDSQYGHFEKPISRVRIKSGNFVKFSTCLFSFFWVKLFVLYGGYNPKLISALIKWNVCINTGE